MRLLRGRTWSEPTAPWSYKWLFFCLALLAILLGGQVIQGHTGKGLLQLTSWQEIAAAHPFGACQL